jgi:hypothetical protein
MRRATLTRAERVLVPLLLGTATGLIGCGNAPAPSCITVPQSIPNRVLADQGAKLTIHTGTVIFAVVEDGELPPGPGDFAWRQTETAEPRVLVRVHLCKITGVTSVPESITGFRAVGQGTATLSAPLAAGWRQMPHHPPAYRATVRVLR